MSVRKPPSDSMRIAVFSDTFLPQINGVVRSIVTAANALVGLGHEVAIFTVDAHNGSAEAANELDDRVRVRLFSALTPPSYKDTRVRVPSFVTPCCRVSRFKPHLIHSHTNFGMAWEAVVAARLLKVPLVGSHHGFLAEYLSNVRLDYPPIKDLMRRYLAFYYNRCGVVITPSRALTTELLEHGLRRPVHVISNPVDFSHFSTLKPKAMLRRQFNLTKPTVVHVGRLIPQKSIDVLVQAFALLRNSGIDANLLIIGEGRQQPRILAQVRELQLLDRVLLTGMLQGAQLVERVAACDLFVSASTTETQGLVFLEAMALGLPAIGVDAGGVPEYVRHEENGLLVAPHDPAALADAMVRLLRDPALRTGYGSRAQRDVKAYEVGQVIGQVERLYHDLLNTAGRKRHQA